jgi:hypothetical protein
MALSETQKLVLLNAASAALDRLKAKCLARDVKLTLIIRHPDHDGSGVIVTDDTYDAAILELQRAQERDEPLAEARP